MTKTNQEFGCGVRADNKMKFCLKNAPMPNVQRRPAGYSFAVNTNGSSGEAFGYEESSE
jgi:hypothetical protein